MLKNFHMTFPNGFILKFSCKRRQGEVKGKMWQPHKYDTGWIVQSTFPQLQTSLKNPKYDLSKMYHNIFHFHFSKLDIFISPAPCINIRFPHIKDCNTFVLRIPSVLKKSFNIFNFHFDSQRRKQDAKSEIDWNGWSYKRTLKKCVIIIKNIEQWANLIWYCSIKKKIRLKVTLKKLLFVLIHSSDTSILTQRCSVQWWNITECSQ